MQQSSIPLRGLQCILVTAAIDGNQGRNEDVLGKKAKEAGLAVFISESGRGGHGVQKLSLRGEQHKLMYMNIVNLNLFLILNGLFTCSN